MGGSHHQRKASLGSPVVVFLWNNEIFKRFCLIQPMPCEGLKTDCDIGPKFCKWSLVVYVFK